MTCKPSPLSRDEAMSSLVEELGETVDSIRQIATDLGARPYRVFLITTEWTGEEIGEGIERVASEVEILPTPKVSPITALSKSLTQAGLIEQGELRVTGISTSFKEWELRGVQQDGKDLPDNRQFFYEMRMDARSPTAETLRRRFALSKVPFYDAERVQWVVELKKAAEDRMSTGDLQ